MKALREKSFRGWPPTSSGLDVKEVFTAARGGIEFSAFDFTSQENIRLRLYLAHRAGLKRADLDLVVLNTVDAKGWTEFLSAMQVGFADKLPDESLPGGDKKSFEQTTRMFRSQKWAMAYVAPRGIGPASTSVPPATSIRMDSATC